VARVSSVASAPTDVGVSSATWSLELLASILLLASLLLAFSVLLFLFFLTMLFRPPCRPFRCYCWRSLVFQFSLVLLSVLLLLFLYILLIFLESFFAVVARVPTVAVYPSSATVAGTPAVATAITFLVLLTILKLHCHTVNSAVYTTSRNRLSTEDGFRLLVSSNIF
jgi:hypothetical protein